MGSKYKEILDGIEWSFSTGQQYRKCPYSVYLKKIEEIEGDDNAYAEIGSYGHELNERIFKKEITVQEALDECVDEFDDHITNYISEASKEKKFLALCDYLAAFDENVFADFEIIGVENEFHWEIDGRNCIGYADLILKRKSDDKVFLIDHKSAPHFMKKDGTPLKNQVENFESYRNQMNLYCDAMKKKLGYYPDFIVWNHFLDNGQVTVIPFNKEEMDKSIEWFLQTIGLIYEDEEFEAKENYIMCYQLCDYRNGLCVYKDIWREEKGDCV